MSATSGIADVGTATPAALGRAFLRRKAANALVWCTGLWIFSGFFVLFEPAPYEVLFLLTLGLSLFGGLRLHRETSPLLYIFVAFVPFALIGAFQVVYMDLLDALIYNIVTIFLFLTSYFAANFVAQSPYRHMRLIAKAYLAAAVIAAIVGTLTYLRLIPGSDAFLLYGRAKAFFKDPNVYGPFLILPALFALQRTLLGSRREVVWGGLVYLVLFIGVFVSFSRGAWGHLAVSSAMVFFLCFFLEAKASEQVRMLLLAIGGAMVLCLALVALLSIDPVAALFAERFSVTQSYDTGETGRFGRIGYALDLALTHPWGLGPLEFSWLRIAEQPHNTYINVFHAYGWGGGFAYIVLVLWTLGRGTAGLAQKTPNRLLLIPIYSTFVPLIILSGIIDTDHWRHWFLVVGLLWGVLAGRNMVVPEQRAKLRALP